MNVAVPQNLAAIQQAEMQMRAKLWAYRMEVAKELHGMLFSDWSKGGVDLEAEAFGLLRGDLESMARVAVKAADALLKELGYEVRCGDNGESA